LPYKQPPPLVHFMANRRASLPTLSCSLFCTKRASWLPTQSNLFSSKLVPSWYSEPQWLTPPRFDPN
ncbi:hypothetical protein CLOM_g17396, partial [Closterium sp. NIES-68]